MQSQTVRLKPTVRARPARLGTRKVTRAHVLLAGRSDLSEAAATLVNRACEALTDQLGCRVEGSGKLIAARVGEGQLSDRGLFALLELADLGAPAVLELELPFAVGMLERLSGGGGKSVPASRLTRIEEGAFSFLLLCALSRVRPEPLARRFGVQLDRVTTEASQAASALGTGALVGFEISLTIADQQGVARVLLPAAVLQGALLELPRPHGVLADEIGAASFPFLPRLGRCVLERSAAEALGPGDVIVLERAGRSDAGLRGELRLLGPRLELHGELDGNQFTFTRAIERGFLPEVTMPEVIQELAAPSVDVEVELTRVRLQVSELATLKPGVILPLKVSPSDPVLLRIGDRVVARAELVDIEGEIGARLLAFVP